jgi:hypothetical protein
MVQVPWFASFLALDPAPLVGKAPKTEVVVLPGINHLLVPAKDGDLAEYGSLTDRTISPEIA